MNILVTCYIFSWFFLKCQCRGIVNPSIIWDPRNPLFSCEDPLIKVHHNDEVNFVCPDLSTHTFILQDKSDVHLVESMHFVGTEGEYNSCNATGGKHLITCGASSQSTNYHMPFIATSSDSLPFAKGKTLHFIGTSFRISNKENNMEGGSCNYTNNKNEFKLRMKIYICTDEDISSGNCELCKTDTCYYANCNSNLNCTAWEKNTSDIYTKNGKCFTNEYRQCNNHLLGLKSQETRPVEIACPKTFCSEWIDIEGEKYLTKPGECKKGQKQNCSNGLITKVERSVVKTQCPDIICSDWKTTNKLYFGKINCEMQHTRTCMHPWTDVTEIQTQNFNTKCPNITYTGGPKIEKSTSTKEEGKQLKYLLVGAVLLFFIVGLLVGVGCMRYKYRHNRAMIKEKTKKEVKGYNNQVFTPDTISRKTSSERYIATILPPENEISQEQYIAAVLNNAKHLNSSVRMTSPHQIRSHSIKPISSTPIETPPRNRRNTVSSKNISRSDSLEKNDSGVSVNRYPNINRQASDLHNLMRPPKENFRTRLQSTEEYKTSFNSKSKPISVMVDEF